MKYKNHRNSLSKEENLMSTDYRSQDEILMCELFDGRLNEFGISEIIVDGKTSTTSRFLTDGNNYLWVYGDETVSYISRFGMNAPGKILAAIVEVFITDIFSEYEPQFWGFETQEEWDLAMEKMAERDRVEFYKEIIKYVNSESHGITPGTNGQTMGDIAKKLVTDDPELLSIERKTELMDAIDKIYDDEYAVKIKLDDEDIEFARLISTHEDDLPSA